MKNLNICRLIFLILLFNQGVLFSQTIKLYQGTFESGTATYQYYENENYERIFQGSFKYKGTVVDDLKGKINLTVTGQYNLDKKDGAWTYILYDPWVKGTTEIVTGAYSNGMMEGEWNSVTTVNATKKIIKKTAAQFKMNKLIGELKFDYTAFSFKEYSSISLKGNFNDSGLFNGAWLTDYTQGNIQYEEIRKYKNGVLCLLLHKRLSDGAILEKMDSTDFVTRFFENYDSVKQVSIVKNQKYVLQQNPDKYSGTLDLPIFISNYWTQNTRNSYFTSISATNPMFLIEHGYSPTPVFHERVIINWKNTNEGEKQTWQDEQNKKANEEKFYITLEKADSAFKGKLFANAILLYKNALLIKDVPYVQEQIQKAQQIIDQERMAKEQEQKAIEKAYREIIVKADSAVKEKKYDVAVELFQSALDIKKEEQYPKDQIKFIKQIKAEEIRLKLVQDLDKTLVTVETGTFKMGCLRSDLNCLKNEEPVHDVTLSSFQICKYEITNSQYKAYCKIKGKKEPQGSDSLPVTNVSWNEAAEFADWLGYRLPTEAEWEYAARGGIKNKKSLYSGGNDLDNIAWYIENSSKSTHFVGSKKPNILGIYDMTGNVWEWCSDWYGDYNESAVLNPRGPATGTTRVKRGGSFSESNFESDLRVTNRNSEPPEFSSYNLGIRLVKK
jgi:formylglycine-generating enzyme required for sulfatase activity